MDGVFVGVVAWFFASGVLQHGVMFFRSLLLGFLGNGNG